MNRWLGLVQSFALTLLLGASATAARAAPPQLLNKTVNVEMSITAPAKSPDGTESIRVRQISRTIYVSSQGRLFQKVARRARRGASDSEFSPDSGGGVHFAGNKLVGVVRVMSGANMLTISFDPSFQSCTAEMVMGFEGNKPRVWKGLKGQTFISTAKPSVSGISCSIREGNAFAS